MKPLLALAQKFKTKKVPIPAAISFALVIIIIISAAPDSGAVATSNVMKGPFAVSITTSGEIRATNSTTLTTPRKCRFLQASTKLSVPLPFLN